MAFRGVDFKYHAPASSRLAPASPPLRAPCWHRSVSQMRFPTVLALASDLSAGRTTSRRLVEQCLTRINDPKGEGARAFTKVYADAALAEADASDKLRALGVVRSPVEGIPISVKDLFDVAGDCTLAGSKALRNAAPATADAPAVARLRAAGAIIVGRTGMVEFAFGGVGINPHYGTPKNPWDRASGGRIPGGSSSGAAVAVADGMCAMSLPHPHHQPQPQPQHEHQAG